MARKKTARLAIKITVVLLVVFFTARLYIRATDGFHPDHLTYQFPKDHPWQNSPLSDEIPAIFKQELTYLGKGAQCYAFGSADGNYVIKFFKFKHHNPSFLEKFLPMATYRKMQREKHQKKVDSAFYGYDLAWRKHQKETGLLYLHLNKTNYLNLKAIIQDKIGRKYELELDPLVFVVQKRAKMTQEVLSQYLQGNDLEETEKKLEELFSFFHQEHSHQIFDRDHCVPKNTGFTKDGVIRVDAGKLAHSELIDSASDQRESARKILLWVESRYPQHQRALEDKINFILSKT